MALRASATSRIGAAPAVVFDFLTDTSKLPNWNRAITEVVDTPTRLSPGTVWRVRIHALGRSWISKSQVTELDRGSFHFSYRSQSDDGNPSYADWTWQVEPDGEGSQVSVTVELKPITFWRKHLLVKVRRPALRDEMLTSLKALGDTLRSS